MTPPIVLIADLQRYEGETVTVRGWLYDRTDKGKLQFLKVRDGSGIAQAVAFQKELPEPIFNALRSLPQESSLIVTGIVRADQRAPGFPGGYEIGVTDAQIIQVADEYPITPKEHGIEFLMDHRHLWVRSSRQWAILRIRATIISAIRNWLDDHGYLLVDTPIITPTAGESTTELFEVKYFEDIAYLAQTGQLYNEANMMSFGKVYCFGPTFRSEKSKTRRHLTEFWMVEPEMAFFTLEDLMAMEEEFVSAIVQRVLEKNRMELSILERDTAPLERVVAPFPRISYDEAVARLNQLAAEASDPEEQAALRIEWGNDFGSPHETALAQQFDRPVFVYHYPTAVKAFYMQPVPGRPEVCRSVDLLAPEGYGEITGGSERIHDRALLEERIAQIGLNRDHYAWYLDLRRFGSVPHAGFGLGVERTVAWICGLPHIRETIPYPRMLKRTYP
ncbi:MAG: asparagine--tRNA ligase [Candidatus Thermofonsia Clade 1 bacterium]|uniref:Asparagine--tRNA ligase n=1 Tax=Candidatus Thermofonsia Clade 1 bacterium TaxID=2364210 RepID=A0A2M8PHT7_9CHLR|nr:MAG: asparagine--tRNA ligase [Candidatus Thermofonsia Clade 1 bacterium]